MTVAAASHFVERIFALLLLVVEEDKAKGVPAGHFNDLPSVVKQSVKFCDSGNRNDPGYGHSGEAWQITRPARRVMKVVDRSAVDAARVPARLMPNDEIKIK